jgi:thioredoxin-like negative regulator of GroEL
MALAGDPHYPPIKLDLAEVLIHSSDLDSAEKLLKDPPFQQQKEAAVKILAAQLAFARSVQFAASPAALKRRLTADPGDLAPLSTRRLIRRQERLCRRLGAFL